MSTKKNKKKDRAWSKEPLQGFRINGWQSVIEKAEKENDENLLLRVRGFDLSACEAKYHQSCRKSYMSKGYDWSSSNTYQTERQNDLENAHNTAFKEVCNLIDEQIILKNKFSSLQISVKFIQTSYSRLIFKMMITEVINRGRNSKSMLSIMTNLVL